MSVPKVRTGLNLLKVMFMNIYRHYNKEIELKQKLAGYRRGCRQTITDLGGIL